MRAANASRWPLLRGGGQGTTEVAPLSKVYARILCIYGAAQTLECVPSPDPDLTRLRDIFVSARAASGMTFEELAEESGLHRQTLTNIARGTAKGDLRTWLMLSRAFDVNLDELLAPVWGTARPPA